MSFDYDVDQLDFYPTTWTSRDGSVIEISELEPVHLANCIAMLERKGWDPSPLLQALKEEKAKRP